MGKGDATRYNVLAEATKIASRVGLSGLTIGSLAQHLQMSKSGLFAHFRAKEALELAVLEYARDLFIHIVVRPALAAPRGEPRIRLLLERWLRWDSGYLPGGCLFIAATIEFDDQPGPVRDQLVRNQREWLETIANVCRSCVRDGEFSADADPDQFAQDLYGIMLAYHFTSRLLREQHAETRARRAFDSLLASVRAPVPPIR